MLDASAGRLPDWAVVGEARLAHIERVAALMEEWATASGEHQGERQRWRAAAWLHDALRDAPPETLRPLVPEAMRSLPPRLLHGPATARRLADEGVDDAALLLAVGYHTLGHPRLDRLGRVLYVADFLEPGRQFLPDERAALRHRMPRDLDAVLAAVVRMRMTHLLEDGCTIRVETLEFWNALAAERGADACTT